MAKPDPAELNKYHHYFAVECNNRAWDLAEQASRSADEVHEMLRCAAASAWHWSAAGGAIQQARALVLLGWVNAVVCRPADARGHTDAAAAAFDACGDEAAAWDRAFVQLLEARTRLAEGDPARYAEAVGRLDKARGLLRDADEQRVFDQFRAGLPDTP